MNIKVAKVLIQNPLKVFGSIKEKRMFPSHQAECGNQAIQSEYMIAVKMADKNMTDLPYSYPVFPELHLGAFSAIY
jgi:hypothetical protein